MYYVCLKRKMGDSNSQVNLNNKENLTMHIQVKIFYKFMIAMKYDSITTYIRKQGAKYPLDTPKRKRE